MSIAKSSIITADDIKALKAVVANECSASRRGRTNGTGQYQSNGTLSGYYSAVNNFSPAKNGTITASQISTMTKPTYKARNNSERSVSKGDIISLQDLNSQASLLAGKGITSSDHGCNAACTGLCSSGCYSACSGCTGSCQGSCSGCSGSCSGTCSGCSGSCSGSCSGGCQGCDGCSGTNICQNCNGNCSGCWSCTGSCHQVG